jgi:serine/threonine-protein kinase
MNSIADRYELLEVIASGGMATVWRARDTKLNRLVALKRPHPAPKGSDHHMRFESEGQIAATVTHPNLVTVFDAGSDEDGPFLVMELIDVPTLAAGSIANSDLPVLGSQIAAALGALHTAGIVHRDVKPANILLAPMGAKLTDFGIARSPASGTGLTQPGAVMATPEYAAPEVLVGEEPSPASDVYSLGAVLKQGLADSRNEQIDRIINAAMSSNPMQRPTAVALAEALSAVAPVAAARGAESTQSTAVSHEPADATAELPISMRPEPVATTGADEAMDPEPKRRKLLPWAVTLAFVLAALAIVGAVMSDDAPTLDEVGAPATTTTSVVETSVAPESEPTAVPTEATASDTDLEDDVDAVVTLIEDTPRNVLEKEEADDIVQRVVDGVASALSGAADDAEQNLRRAVNRIDEKLDSQRIAEQARSLIKNLGIRLGLSPDEVVEPDSES